MDVDFVSECKFLPPNDQNEAGKCDNHKAIVLDGYSLFTHTVEAGMADFPEVSGTFLYAHLASQNPHIDLWISLGPSIIDTHQISRVHQSAEVLNRRAPAHGYCLTTMIDNEELRLAGNHLRAAWRNYAYVFSGLQNRHPSGTCSISPELGRQLDTELAFISSYEPKIEEIKASINRARNCSSLAPINTLPPEILSRIFHHALAQPCDSLPLRFGEKTSCLENLDRLTEVCNLWRRTAISTCSLWSHIDLSPSERVCDKLIARAKLYVARAGILPIELHVEENERYDPDASTASRSYHDGLHMLLSPIYSRIKTLELTTRAFEGFQRTLFRKLFFYEDSNVTKLVVRSSCHRHDSFIFPVGSHFDDDGMDESFQGSELDISSSELERGLARLTTLHLHGIFPLWSSTAYHGLVDLRLLSVQQWSSITQPELVTILMTSPGLRILHFGLQIITPLPDTAQVTPVHLPDLQVVKIFSENDNEITRCPSGLLRLLAPGNKPLRLSIHGRYEPSDMLLAEFENFFSRSRVARFYSRGVIPPMSVLVRHATDLEVVIFHDFVSSPRDPPSSAWLEADGLGSLPHLRSVHLSRSIPYEKELELFLKYCPTGIVLDCCDVERDVGESWLSRAELLDRFPTVTVMNRSIYAPDPTEDWDVVD